MYAPEPRGRVPLGRRYDAGAVVVGNTDAEGSRHPIDTRDDLAGELALRQHRAAALPARSAIALIERIDADLGKCAAVIMAGGGEVLPIVGRGDVALGAVAGAHIEEVGRRRVVAKAEALVGPGREARQRLVLHDEIAERIEDRL